MAYREVAMWEILSVLERVGRGESQRAVARITSHSAKTIRRYLATARELGWEPGGEAPTEALAAEIYARRRLARDRGPGEVEDELLPHLAQIKTWLSAGPSEKRGLRLTKVQQLLARQGLQNDCYPFTLDRVVKAAAPVGMAGRPGLVNQQQQRITVAVDAHCLQSLRVSGSLSLAPIGLAGPRPVTYAPGPERLPQGFGIHPGKHQDLA
jgi:hypothetical protein